MPPLYSVQPDMLRASVPRIVLIVTLGALFYLGISLNFMFLNRDFETIYILLTIVVILVLAVFGVLEVLSLAKTRVYEFYEDRIIIKDTGQKVVMLRQIENVKMEKSVFDNLFSTFTLKLRPVSKIENVPASDQLYLYVTKLVARARQKY